MSLATYADQFRRLKVNVAHGRASPHKICMLLAVLDLARGGALTENRIEYAPPLLERYAMYFNAVRSRATIPILTFPSSTSLGACAVVARVSGTCNPGLGASPCSRA